MSDPDRVYARQGAEPPLTIDRERRRRPRGPAPVTLIVSVLLLVVVLGGVLYMYRAGARGPTDAPRPLGAPLGDVRTPPPAQTQTPDASAGLTISKDEPNAPPASAPTLAPPPENPLPTTAAPTAVPSSTPPPPPSAPGGETPSHTAGRQSPSVPAAEKPDAIDRLIAKAERTGTAAKADGDPEHGAILVQIGAFSSQTLADQEWNKAAAVAPGAMAGKGKRVVPIARDGATLYRTSITGFASREQAQALCSRLKAAGGVCFVH